MTKDFLRIWIEKMEGLEDFVPDATVDSQNRPYGAYDHHEISTSVGLVTHYWIACDGTVTPLEFRLPGTVERLKKLLETAPGVYAAEINASLCKGCGTCASWCPSGAITSKHFTDRQVHAMIDAFFAEEAEEVLS